MVTQVLGIAYRVISAHLIRKAGLLLFVLPGFISILILSILYAGFRSSL